MGVDLVGEMIRQQNAYGRLRGTRPSVNQPGRTVPMTTWADAFVLYYHVMKYANPDVDDCVSLMMKHDDESEYNALRQCRLNGGPLDFLRTSQYNNAVQQFKTQNPVSKWWTQTNVDVSWEYPYNEQLWAAARNVMSVRDAVGEVPYWSEVVLDSVYEAIQELPGTIGSALAVVDPRQLVPDFAPWVKLLKWSSIAGGLYLFYSITKPKKPKAS